MGGKRKRNLQMPTSSLTRTPPSLPKQYDFTPRSISSPPVIPETRQPSVKDYPPPMKLFASSSVAPERGAFPSPPSHATPTVPSSMPPAQQAPEPPTSQSPLPLSEPAPVTSQPSSHHPSQSPPLRSSHSPPLRSSHSPHSSHAQNQDTEDDCNSNGQPNLSDNQLTSLNSLLQQPRSKHITFLDPNLTEPDSTWFGFDKSSLTRKITKVFTQKFDGPFYSWSCVPRERQERYLIEFARTHRWDPRNTGLVQQHFESIIQLRMKDMVSTVRTSDEQPRWISDTLWAEMRAHWKTDEQVDKSGIFSGNRLSDRNGLGPHKHTTGQMSWLQLEQEMVIELKRPVSFGEVFIRAHTKKDGTYVDDLKAKQVAEAYLKKKKERLDVLQSETTEPSDGHELLLPIEEDNDLFIQTTFTNKHGDLFGLGSLKKLLKGKRNNVEASPSFQLMQKQLEEAQRKIEELLAAREVENAEFKASQKAYADELAIVNKFLKTDERYLAFLAKETCSQIADLSSEDP